MARVRLIHASPNAPAVDVAVAGGQTLFTNVSYGQVSNYGTLAGGTYDLVVRQAGTGTELLRLSDVVLDAGNVHSLALVGLQDGTPALQLVTIRDLVVTARTTQASYSIHQAQTGEWQVKLSGYIDPLAAYQLSVVGAIPEPGLDGVRASMTGSTGAQVTYRLTADRPGTVVGIYANAGSITATHVITTTQGFTETVEVPEYNGVLVATEPNPPYDGSLQTVDLDLSGLRSGTYHIWVEAGEVISAPVRVYSPDSIEVTSPWQETWQANIQAEPSYGEVFVSWDRCPNPDVDGYALYVSTEPDVTTEPLTLGDVEATSVWAVDPGRTFYITLGAYDEETGKEARSEQVSVTSTVAEFELEASTTELLIRGGHSATVDLTLTTALDPYPDSVGLYPVTVPDGLSVQLGDTVVVPTVQGVGVPLHVSATEWVPGGPYTVVIEARGGGMTHALTLQVTVQKPYFMLTATPDAVTLEEGGAAEVMVETTDFFGHGNPILLRLDLVPPGLVWSLSAGSVLPGQSFALTLQDTEVLCGGEHTLHIIGEDGRNVHDLALPLTVAKRDFGLFADEASLRVVPGSSAVFALDVTVSIEWSQPVTLSVDASQLPPGSTAALSVEPPTSPPTSEVAEITVTPPDQVYLAVTVLQNAPRQAYRVTVYGDSEGRRHWVDLRLEVYELEKMYIYLPIIMKWAL
jgi:hypothetical protein